MNHLADRQVEMLSRKQAELWVLVAAGWGDELRVADGSLFGQRVEGPIDVARAMGLEDALPYLQTNLSIWLITPPSLGCCVQIFLGCSPWH